MDKIFQQETTVESQQIRMNGNGVHHIDYY